MDIFTIILFKEYIELKNKIDNLQWYNFIKKSDLTNKLSENVMKIKQLDIFELCIGLINYTNFNDNNILHFDIYDKNSIFIYNYGLIEFYMDGIRVLYNSKYNSFNIIYGDEKSSISFEISSKTTLSSVRGNMWNDICINMVDIVLEILPNVRCKDNTPEG